MKISIPRWHKLGAPDGQLLDRATELVRALFTQDDDLLVEAQKRLSIGVYFGGVIYAHQLRITIGECVRDLELVAEATGPKELADHVLYLPL